MPAGRPTAYSDDILTKTAHYISHHNDKECPYKDVIPSMAGLSLALDVCVKTLYNWGEVHDEFLHMLDKLQKTQEKVLLNGGLSGVMNSTITKLVLSKHNYSDKVDSAVDHTTNGKDLGTTVTFVNSTK
tara:strand:- start:2873 stop:3259 length:387 start_codon:yes stop_codon:yes gene_type:complete